MKKNKLLRAGYLVVFIFFNFIVLYTFVFHLSIIEGNSMYPTLKNHDIVFISRISQIKRGDIILFQDRQGVKNVKRVIGMPSDKINYKKGALFVNDVKKDASSFINRAHKSSTHFSLKSLTEKSRVPRKAYFVMGDNRVVSYDSRAYGFIYEKQIYGKVVFAIKGL